jgi:hypothetical protein
MGGQLHCLYVITQAHVKHFITDECKKNLTTSSFAHYNDLILRFIKHKHKQNSASASTKTSHSAKWN